MFTGCSTVCPIQGAWFAALQVAMAAEHGTTLRLLSLSIDPLADDPAALSAWLRRFGAGPAWSAAALALALERGDSGAGVLGFVDGLRVEGGEPPAALEPQR
jgi:protein SCO1/2